jgi:triosephosphate isomerase
MNLTPSEGAKLAGELAKAVKGTSHKVMIAPTFVSLPAVVAAVKGSKIIVAAQNMNDHESGAFTGEVSAKQLLDLGVRTVILGHSERRHIYGESNELINRKVLFALQNGMDVDLCVGETLDERESGNLEKVLSDQITIGLSGVTKSR